MARKKLGYTRLEWTCPNCKTSNPGPQKTCSNCGAPQPEDVHFEQAAHAELIKDEKKIARPKAGADIHCPYCGTRNPAGTEICSQCGGDLTSGKRRKSGRVLGAFRKGELKKVTCPTCGAHNPSTATECRKCGAPLHRKKSARPSVPATKRARSYSRVTILLVIVALVINLGLRFLWRGIFGRFDLDGVVHNVHWERSLVVEQLSLVQDADWLDDIPDDASLLGCELEYRYTSDEPAENSVEVCGTPYTVDTGDGFGDVVQDCVYEVYEEYCEYEVEDWVTYDTIRLQGDSLSVRAPVSQLTTNQRQGKQVERYDIVFDTDEGGKTFKTDDYMLFSQCRIGSRWVLTLDGFGKIKEIEPYR